MSRRKFYFLVKCCVLFMSVMTGLSLFEFWRSGECTTRTCAARRLEEEYERQVLQDEARVVPGLGERGAAAALSRAEERLGEDSFNANDINVYLSDRISYSRTLPDVRSASCRHVVYDAELPSTSVVIVFHNEPYSLLLRTVWNVLTTARRDRPWHDRASFVERKTNRTTKLGYPGQEPDSEYVYLKEIILVDDNSTLPELRGKLSHYVRTRLPPGLVRLLRLPERGGLTRARQAGARAAQGDALLFLDAHCEGLQDWIRPLLQRVKDQRTAVVVPYSDMIDAHNFEYTSQKGHPFVGGFNFAGFYTWAEVPQREMERRNTDTSSYRSPTMAGGLFVASRSYFWQLGGYDDQMRGWGGENLEMSFRIWQCGGSLEMVPCSNVGHVYRSFHPYGPQEDTQGPNMARVAEVWMDDYAELFYLLRPDLKLHPRVGDVSARKALRKKLRCRSFQWYLDTVYPEKFVPVRDALLYGRVQNAATELCLDTLDRRRQEYQLLGINLCRAALTDGQHFSLSHEGQLRNEEQCAYVEVILTPKVAAPKEIQVQLVTCHSMAMGLLEQWEYVPATQQLRHERSGWCLDARYVILGEDAKVRACTNDSAQRWTFDYGGSKRSSWVLPPDVEMRLQKLGAKRRDS